MPDIKKFSIECHEMRQKEQIYTKENSAKEYCGNETGRK
jgi:hypothetical protein